MHLNSILGHWCPAAYLPWDASALFLRTVPDQAPGELSQTLVGSKFWIEATYTALCTKLEW